MSESRWRRRAQRALEPGPRCPDDETLRRFMEGAAAGDVGEFTVNRHVETCRRCQVELDEMRAFFTEVPSSARAGDLQVELREVLHAVEPGLAEGGVASPRRRWLWPSVAAAAVLLVGVLGIVGLRGRGAPPIPAVDAGPSPLRGLDAPVALSPAGPQPGVPRRLSWESGAPGPWSVRLERVDGILLWTATVAAPAAELPEDVARELAAGSTYVWRVKEVGARPDREASMSFVIVPSAGPEDAP